MICLKKGFTLIEALICLFLTVCLMWGTLPQFLKHQKEREIRLACLTVRQILDSARFMAIKERSDFEVVVGDGDNALRIRKVSTGQEVDWEEKLPEGIIISRFSRDLRPIIFRPSGGLAGISGSMTVRDERTGEEKRIVLYNLTGKIKITE
jgi:Tfp pilus assembly protein FimT